MWQEVAIFFLQNLTFDFAVFLDFREHARQLSMLRIIQPAWLQTFTQFICWLSLCAGELLSKILPKSTKYDYFLPHGKQNKGTQVLYVLLVPGWVGLGHGSLILSRNFSLAPNHQFTHCDFTSGGEK